jgi:hypothetical protein
MDQDDLFAEFLFNKTKVKALNNLQPLTGVNNSDVLTPFLTEAQSIFVSSLQEYITDDEVMKDRQRQEDFLVFLKQELPSLVSKFYKMCNGKTD